MNPVTYVALVGGRSVPVDEIDAREAALRAGNRASALPRPGTGAVCDLDLVVIGGGVAKSGPLLFGPLRAALTDYAGLKFLRGLRVVPAELGGDAGLVGAAALVRG